MPTPLHLHSTRPCDKKQAPLPDRVAISKVANALELSGHKAHGRRVNSCSRHLIISECPHGHEYHVVSADRCRDRWCPVCSRLRSRIAANKIRAAVATVQAANPKQRWALLTLTVKTVRGTDLQAAVTDMLKAWTKLSRRSVFKRSVVGGVRTLEVTWRRGHDGILRAHPHIHVLIAMGKYLDKADWQAAWKAAACLDYDPIIDIRAVADPREAAVEVAKYVSKSPKASVDLVESLRWEVPALSGRRLWTPFGVLRTINLDDGCLDKEVAEEGSKVVALTTCRTCGATLVANIKEWNAIKKEYEPIPPGVVDNGGNMDRTIEILIRGNPDQLSNMVFELHRKQQD